MRRLAAIAASLAGCWLLTLLCTTPRGDRILARAGEALFPDSVTK